MTELEIKFNYLRYHMLRGQRSNKWSMVCPRFHSFPTYSDPVDEGSSSDCDSRTPGKIYWLRGDPLSLSVIRWVPDRFAVFVLSEVDGLHRVGFSLLLHDILLRDRTTVAYTYIPCSSIISILCSNCARRPSCLVDCRHFLLSRMCQVEYYQISAGLLSRRTY